MRTIRTRRSPTAARTFLIFTTDIHRPDCAAKGFPTGAFIQLDFPSSCVILIIIRLILALETRLKISLILTGPVCRIVGITQPAVTAAAANQVLVLLPC